MTKLAPTVFCLGANHKSAGLDLREKLYLSRDEIVMALPQLREHHDIKECLVLSTCNRLEIYGVLHAPPENDEQLFEAFYALRRFDRHDEDARSNLRERCYLHLGLDAVKHIFAVCSGLDSLVVGETQITGQFKAATAIAQEYETVGTVLGRIGQEALASAKKVRTQTDIGKKTVSIGHAAIDLAEKVYGAVSEHRVAIIGAGEMGALAARYAVNHNPKRLVVVNRSFEKAEALVKDLGQGHAHHIDELEAILSQSDIVITATSSQDPIITPEMVERVQVVRNNRPILFVDIALPRNVDARVSKLEDVYAFDIDDLKQVVEANSEERRLAADRAFKIVAENAEQFMKWLATFDIKPVIAGFKGYLDDLLQRESGRTLGREMFRSLDNEQREALKAMLGSVAAKITADVSAALRQPPEGYYQDQLAEALSVLFPAVTKEREVGT